MVLLLILLKRELLILSKAPTIFLEGIIINCSPTSFVLRFFWTEPSAICTKLLEITLK